MTNTFSSTAKGKKLSIEDSKLLGIPTMQFFRILSVLAVFALWEVCGLIPISVAFPTFTGTMRAMFEMIFDGRLIYAYGETLKPLGAGILISGFFGVMIGVSMGLNRKAQWVWEPIFIVLQASPVAALIPLITYAYGIGIAAKTVAVIMLASPIIVLNTYKAVRHANPSLIQMSRSFQGSRLQTIWFVIIPNAAPVMFAGLRLGAAAGFIGVILAELLITPTGVGDLISYNRATADYEYMYAAVFTVILFSALLASFLETVEVKYFRPEKKKGRI